MLFRKSKVRRLEGTRKGEGLDHNTEFWWISTVLSKGKKKKGKEKREERENMSLQEEGCHSSYGYSSMVPGVQGKTNERRNPKKNHVPIKKKKNSAAS